MKFELIVETKHYKNATEYMSVTECPLAIALKELFPTGNIRVGGYNIDLDYDIYDISENWFEFGAREINKRINDAKNEIEIEPITVTFTKRISH
jgi:hypothetical protein